MSITRLMYSYTSSTENTGSIKIHELSTGLKVETYLICSNYSTKKLRHLTTQSLNHQILKFGGALITIDCAGLSYMDFAYYQTKVDKTFVF